MPETLNFHAVGHATDTLVRLEEENIEPKLLRISPEYAIELQHPTLVCVEEPLEPEHGEDLRLHGLPVFIDSTLEDDPFVIAEGLPRGLSPEVLAKHKRRLQARMAYLRGDDPFEEILPVERAECGIGDALKSEMENRRGQAEAAGEHGA